MNRYLSHYVVIAALLALVFSSRLSADTDNIVLADANGIVGALDITGLGDCVQVSNIDSLSSIQTDTGQLLILDGDELQALSVAGLTLTILGDGAVDVINSNLLLPNDGSAPSVNNLLTLEFSGLDTQLSIVPDRLSVEGSHISAIAAFWIQLDQAYVGSADYYNIPVNTSFVYLGNDYATYLENGNEAALDLVKVPSGRLQTLHDNLLGNLGDGPITSRFLNLGQDDPRTDAGKKFGSRPYHSGTATTVYADFDLVSSVIGWDLAEAISYPTALPFPFDDFAQSNALNGGDSEDYFFGGADDDTLDGGGGIDVAGFRGEINDYLITMDGSSFRVQDSISSRDGSDTLTAIEQLSFSDGSILLVGANDFSIQSAIDAANDNDVIFVLSGDYSETVTISKPVSLLGAQAGVDARSRVGLTETTLTGVFQLLSAADNVTIDGFTIAEGASVGGEKAGVFVGTGASNSHILNTIFSRSGAVDGDGFRGVVTTTNGGNTDLLVSQNSFSGWATGVYLNPAATDAVIQNNQFDSNFVGMSIDGPSNTFISGNTFSNNGFEGLGIGPGVSSPSLAFNGNSFSDNSTHIGVYTAIVLDLSNEDFDARVEIGGEGTVYSSLQSAIDASSDGDSIDVYPGSYSETANYNSVTKTNDAGASNPLGLVVDKEVEIQGVDSGGVAILDRDDIVTTIESQAQASFGTNFIVSADNVSISGLRFVGAGDSGSVSRVFEVIGNGFSLNASIVTGDTGLAVESAVYVNDSDVPADGSFTLSAITDFNISNSSLFGAVTLTNGAGLGHDPAVVDIAITNNEFLVGLAGTNDGVQIFGKDDTDSSRNASAALPEITGNDFSTANGIFWVTGDDTQGFPVVTYVENLINSNTIPAYAYGLDDTNSLAIGTFSGLSSMAIRPSLASFSNSELANATSLVSLSAGDVNPTTVALQLFDQDVRPDILYGSGNSNGNFTVSVDNGVEVGLRIHDRFDGATHSNGDGTYNPASGFFSGSSGPGFWNYDFSINLNANDETTLTLFDDVIIELKIDLDPTAGTSFLTLNPLTTWTDNAYGNNGTANGDGDDSTEINGTFGVDQNFFVVQNSQNIGWLFNTLGDTLFDVTKDASYDFELSVSDLNSNLLAATSMRVDVGSGGVVEDRSIDSLTFVDGEFQACVQQAAATEGISLVSEMTSLNCTNLGLISVIGIGQLTGLESLNLSNNALTDINVDELTGLQSLTILNNPLSIDTLTYLAGIDGSNGLDVVTQLPVVVVIPDPPAEEPETPQEPGNDDIVEAVDDIVLPGEGDEVPPEVVEAIEDALDDVNNLADTVLEQLESGDVTNEEALDVLETLDSVLEVTGDAASLGAEVQQQEVSDSVENVSLILDALDTETELAPEQEQLIQQVTNNAVDTVADFIDEETPPGEINELITEVGELLRSAGSAGAELNEEVVVATKDLTNKALLSTTDDLAEEFDLAEDVDLSDPIQAAEVLIDNGSLLDAILDVAAVEVPSDIALDTTALLDNLEQQGFGQEAAGSLTEDLAEFVNPIGVNLEIGNGESINALDSMIESVDAESDFISVDELTGGLSVDLGDSEILINVSEVLVVPDSIPEGITELPDGSILSVASGVGVKMVPAPNDPIALAGLLSDGVGNVSFNTNGGLTVDDEDLTFSGTFGFESVAKTGTDSDPQGEPELQAPAEGDPTDPDYTYVVTYADGSSQNIAPFVADEKFFDSLETRGLSFSSSRSNGVVEITDSTTGGVSSFRPDYFVLPLTDSDQQFLTENADDQGIAYRAVDVNGDGITDFESISATGKQVIYGLP